jgi:3-deoxy-manno-octulosonate cytidylyltransferase (CMP-KDO synthetase)
MSLLGHVITAAKKVSLFDEVIVAACSKEVVDLATRYGARAILTEPSAPNGSMRIIEAIKKEGIDGDFFVNWQADEPFITETLIHTLLQGADQADILTLKIKIDQKSAIESSIVKVVTDLEGKALYFSRALIPFQREGEAVYYKHIGLYAFSKKATAIIAGLEQTPLEGNESLEQLRWLEHGLTIKVNITDNEVVSVDTENDLIQAKALMSKIKCV